MSADPLDLPAPESFVTLADAQDEIRRCHGIIRAAHEMAVGMEAEINKTLALTKMRMEQVK